MSAETIEAVAESGLVVPRVLPVKHLSASSMGLFWKCAEAWRRRYILKIPLPPNANMLAGRAVGDALAAYYSSKIAGETLSGSEVDDLCVIGFDRGAEEVSFDKEPAETMREHCRSGVAEYLELLAPEVRPASVERKIEMAFPGAEWRVVGYLDIEDEGGEVIDVKFKKDAVKQADADQDPQATLYLAGRRAEGKPAPRFLFHGGLRKPPKTAPRWQAVATERSERQLDAFEARIAQTARAIARCVETGDWSYATPAGWWCSESFCEHHSSCAGGGLR